MWGLGLTNNILWNIFGSIFHHLPRGGEGKNSTVKVIKSNQEIVIIELDKIIELIKPKKGMVLMNTKQDIQFWQMDRCSIITDGKTLKHVKCIWELSFKPKTED